MNTIPATGLPACWSVRITPLGALCTVTVLDSLGHDRGFSLFKPRTGDESASQRTIESLADIDDLALRDTVATLLDRHSHAAVVALADRPCSGGQR